MGFIHHAPAPGAAAMCLPMVFPCIAKETIGRSIVFRGLFAMAAAWRLGPVQCQPMVNSWAGRVIRSIADHRLRVGLEMCLQAGKLGYVSLRPIRPTLGSINHANPSTA